MGPQIGNGRARENGQLFGGDHRRTAHLVSSLR